jgi:hypothetical protein
MKESLTSLLVLSLCVFCFCSGLWVERRTLESQLKGPLITTAGPYSYRYGVGTVSLKVEIYGTGNKDQCVVVPGEDGKNGAGYYGGVGGKGGQGIFCGEAIALFPGYGGEAIKGDKL